MGDISQKILPLCPMGLSSGKIYTQIHFSNINAIKQTNQGWSKHNFYLCSALSVVNAVRLWVLKWWNWFNRIDRNWFNLSLHYHNLFKHTCICIVSPSIHRSASSDIWRYPISIGALFQQMTFLINVTMGDTMPAMSWGLGTCWKIWLLLPVLEWSLNWINVIDSHSSSRQIIFPSLRNCFAL